MSLIQTFVQQAIQDHPADAAREVPEILGYYILDNTRLNRVYRAAKNVIESPKKTTLAALAHAVRDAEAS
jgi:hypothetical protein